MKVNGVKSYLLGDHLGSTSISTNSAGAKTSELMYTAWGEVRYAWGPTPTDYTFTGQYSNVDDFGLMYYGARWYDHCSGDTNLIIHISHFMAIQMGSMDVEREI